MTLTPSAADSDKAKLLSRVSRPIRTKAAVSKFILFSFTNSSMKLPSTNSSCFKFTKSVIHDSHEESIISPIGSMILMPLSFLRIVRCGDHKTNCFSRHEFRSKPSRNSYPEYDWIQQRGSSRETVTSRTKGRYLLVSESSGSVTDSQSNRRVRTSFVLGSEFDQILAYRLHIL